MAGTTAAGMTGKLNTGKVVSTFITGVVTVGAVPPALIAEHDRVVPNAVVLATAGLLMHPTLVVTADCASVTFQVTAGVEVYQPEAFGAAGAILTVITGGVVSAIIVFNRNACL